MTKSLKLTKILLLALTLTFISACGKTKSRPTNRSLKNSQAKNQTIELKNTENQTPGGQPGNPDASAGNASAPILPNAGSATNDGTEKIETAPTASVPTPPPASAPSVPSAAVPSATIDTPDIGSTIVPAKPTVAETKPSTPAQEPKAKPAEPAVANVKKDGPIELAADSEEIKKTPGNKIAFKNLEVLVQLSKDKNLAYYKGKPVKADESLQKLKNANEESFCRVEGAEYFHKDDYLKLVDGDVKDEDKENDIHTMTLRWGNKNGTISFICTYTTRQFFMEDFRTNFDKVLTLWNLDNSTVNAAGYVNPYTEDRQLNALQIIDMKKFDVITETEDPKNWKAIVNGNIMPHVDARLQVMQDQQVMACTMLNVQGDLDTKKIFVKADYGVSEETPSTIPSGSVYYIYRADKETSFTVDCVLRKKSKVGEFMKASKGIFKFGVLGRKEYKKKRLEMIQIQQEMPKQK